MPHGQHQVAVGVFLRLPGSRLSGEAQPGAAQPFLGLRQAEVAVEVPPGVVEPQECKRGVVPGHGELLVNDAILIGTSRQVAAPREQRLQIIAPPLGRDQRALLERIPGREDRARGGLFRPRHVPVGLLAVDLDHHVERVDGHPGVGVLAGLQILLGVGAQRGKRRIDRLGEHFGARGITQFLRRLDDQDVGQSRGLSVALQETEKTLDRLAQLFGPAGAQHDHVAAAAPGMRIVDRVDRVAVGAGKQRVFVAVAAPVQSREQFVVEHVAQRDHRRLPRRGLGDSAQQTRLHTQPLLERAAQLLRGDRAAPSAGARMTGA